MPGTGERENQNRRLLRARDAMDRHYAHPIDVPVCFVKSWTRQGGFG